MREDHGVGSGGRNGKSDADVRERHVVTVLVDVGGHSKPDHGGGGGGGNGWLVEGEGVCAGCEEEGGGVYGWLWWAC